MTLRNKLLMTFNYYRIVITKFKREKCKKCTETNKRFDGIIWDDSVGCSGCPLAQPELYRGVLI